MGWIRVAAGVAATIAAGVMAIAASESPPAWPIDKSPAHMRPAIARADLIIVAMQDAVLRELTHGLREGGPELAITSCHLDATTITRRIADQEGIAAGRTSHRLRSPANRPKPWAAPLVAAHAGRKARDVEGFVVDLGDRLGVLRPIAHRPMCAGCHGPVERISPAVRQLLADWYPVDKAVGFAEGEIRGWFWVEMPWKQ